MAHSSSEAPYELKQLTSSDQEAVWEMLRYAAHEETASDVRSVPVLVKYAEGFGKLPGDAGFAAVHGNGETGGAVVGVAWVRLLPTGFGYVADDVPELALAVKPRYQGQGIGSKLLRHLITFVQKSGYRGISLSCRSKNLPALRLYERMGFVRLSEVQNDRGGGTSFVMVLMFHQND